MTTARMTFSKIKQAVSLERVLLGYYGLTTLKRRGDKLIGPCPVHGGDNPRAFHANLKENVWYCFTGCGQGGDQLTLVALKERITVLEAAKQLHLYSGGNVEGERSHGLSSKKLPCPDQIAQGAMMSAPMAWNTRGSPSHRLLEPPRPTEGVLSNPPCPVTLTLNPHHPHLKTRGLSTETIHHFGIGHAHCGIMKGCIAIPIHDKHGVLVAYAGRRLDKDEIKRFGKYRFPRRFHKQLVLYNLHRVVVDANIILVEGFFSVMLLHQMGVRQVVASMGCTLSEYQAALLSGVCPKQVTVLFDGNGAGRRGAEQARAMLAHIAPRLPVHVFELAEGREPEDLTPAELEHLTSG